MTKTQSAAPAYSENERYSVTLVPPARSAVDILMSITRLNKADVINRAVQIYAFIEEHRTKQGKELWMRDEDGTFERVHIV